MYEKSRIATAFDGAGIKKAPKLAIPKKEFNARYVMTVEYQLFGMQIELLVQAIDLWQYKHQDQQSGYQPAPGKKQVPLPGNNKMAGYGTPYGYQRKHSLSHNGAGRKNTAGKQVPKTIGVV